MISQLAVPRVDRRAAPVKGAETVQDAGHAADRAGDGHRTDGRPPPVALDLVDLHPPVAVDVEKRRVVPLDHDPLDGALADAHIRDTGRYRFFPILRLPFGSRRIFDMPRCLDSFRRFRRCALTRPFSALRSCLVGSDGMGGVRSDANAHPRPARSSTGWATAAMSMVVGARSTVTVAAAELEASAASPL